MIHSHACRIRDLIEFIRSSRAEWLRIGLTLPPVHQLCAWQLLHFMRITVRFSFFKDGIIIYHRHVQTLVTDSPSWSSFLVVSHSVSQSSPCSRPQATHVLILHPHAMQIKFICLQQADPIFVFLMILVLRRLVPYIEKLNLT